MLLYKLATIHERQGATEERGEPQQNGRWQFQSAREPTYAACLGQLQDEHFSTHTHQNLRSSYRGLNGVESCVPPRSSQYIVLSRLQP